MAAVLALLATAAAAYLYMGAEATRAPHSPEKPSAWEDDGFPAIDWAYWKGVNADVVGWITIPGTTVDYPVVKASKEDPGYWLMHDVYGNWNVYGSIYVDAECPNGLASKNAVILGHHMADGTMFAEVSSYGDLEFMERNRTVLLQTPDWKAAFNVGAAEVIAGWNPVKRTAFESEGDFRGYLSERVEACSVVDRDPNDGEAPANRMVTLCTCSYTTFGDERTLAYAW